MKSDAVKYAQSAKMRLSLNLLISLLADSIFSCDLGQKSTFAIKQVVWKYKGKPIANLGKNTMLKEWIPQNDLLSHENTKLFVTHGGTHSM